jgi:predicted nucleotidyltransferase
MANTIEQDRTKKRRPVTGRTAIVAELKAHASEIRKQGVTSLALFGSRARGDERQDSDLDVLIEYDASRPFTLYDLVRVERLLNSLTGLEVHVATRDGFRPHRLHRVLKDAINVL